MADFDPRPKAPVSEAETYTPYTPVPTEEQEQPVEITAYQPIEPATPKPTFDPRPKAPVSSARTPTPSITTAEGKKLMQQEEQRIISEVKKQIPTTPPKPPEPVLQKAETLPYDPRTQFIKDPVRRYVTQQTIKGGTKGFIDVAGSIGRRAGSFIASAVLPFEEFTTRVSQQFGLTGIGSGAVMTERGYEYVPQPVFLPEQILPPSEEPVEKKAREITTGVVSAAAQIAAGIGLSAAESQQFAESLPVDWAKDFPKVSKVESLVDVTKIEGYDVGKVKTVVVFDTGEEVWSRSVLKSLVQTEGKEFTIDTIGLTREGRAGIVGKTIGEEITGQLIGKKAYESLTASSEVIPEYKDIDIPLFTGEELKVSSADVKITKDFISITDKGRTTPRATAVMTTTVFEGTGDPFINLDESFKDISIAAGTVKVEGEVIPAGVITRYFEPIKIPSAAEVDLDLGFKPSPKQVTKAKTVTTPFVDVAGIQAESVKQAEKAVIQTFVQEKVSTTPQVSGMGLLGATFTPTKQKDIPIPTTADVESSLGLKKTRPTQPVPISLTATEVEDVVVSKRRPSVITGQIPISEQKFRREEIPSLIEETITRERPSKTKPPSFPTPSPPSRPPKRDPFGLGLPQFQQTGFRRPKQFQPRVQLTQKKGYTPDIKSLLFGIIGEAPKETPTGFEERPIPLEKKKKKKEDYFNFMIGGF